MYYQCTWSWNKQFLQQRGLEVKSAAVEIIAMHTAHKLCIVMKHNANMLIECLQ